MLRSTRSLQLALVAFFELFIPLLVGSAQRDSVLLMRGNDFLGGPPMPEFSLNGSVLVCQASDFGFLSVAMRITLAPMPPLDLRHRPLRRGSPLCVSIVVERCGGARSGHRW
jgi:hypothetical protein